MNSASALLELSPEQELLVATARPRPDQRQVERLRHAVTAELNWNLVFDLAAWHGLTPLLTRNLSGNCADLLSADVAAELSSKLGTNVRRSLAATGELMRIVERLRAAGINALPFKGPAQAAQLYGEPFLREFHDLDILITKNQAADAHEILVQAGYVPSVEVAREHLSLYMRSECDRVYVGGESGVHVEMHWAIAPPYFGVGLDAAELIARGEPIGLAGVKVNTLALEDLLLVLCVNGAKEMWEKLEWIGAMAIVLEHELDWDYVDRSVQQMAARRMLLIGLGLARDIFDAPVPVHLDTQLRRDRTAQSLIREAKAWVFAQHFRNLRGWQLTRFRLRARERMRERTRYLVLRSLTPTHQDLAVVRLPRGFYLLYHLIRPSRLAADLFRRRSGR